MPLWRLAHLKPSWGVLSQRILSINVLFQETGRSKGYGFVTYWEAEDAKKALEQMNGFELAGRPMKVGHVTEKPNEAFPGNGSLEFEELDRSVELHSDVSFSVVAHLKKAHSIFIIESNGGTDRSESE